ncbi:MAG TPA: hypothetical protein VGH38_13840 [Bryobacteraceae bacterium]
MKRLRYFSSLALFGQLLLGQAHAQPQPAGGRDGGAEPAEAPPAVAPLPRVLRNPEPADNRIITLPGARVARPARVVRSGSAPVMAGPRSSVPGTPVPNEAAASLPTMPAAGPVPAVSQTQSAVTEEPAVSTPAPALTTVPAIGEPLTPPVIVAPPVDEQPILASPPAPMTVPATGEPLTPPVIIAPPVEEPSGPQAPAAPAIGPPPAAPAPAEEPPAPAPPPASESVPAIAPPVITPGVHSTAIPAEFETDSALFLQKQIGQWTLFNTRNLLGKPQSQRPALDDNQQENGQIYGFEDPTGRYRELELDFDGNGGNLRTVFVYPKDMTWQECRKLFAGNVSATQANKGRTFYSYTNRRLDVLVAPDGQVISLGLY